MLQICNIFVRHFQPICTIFIVRWQPSGGAFVHCGGGQEQVGPKQGQVRLKKIIMIYNDHQRAADDQDDDNDDYDKNEENDDDGQDVDL